MEQQQQLTPEVALGNLITVYKQARLTPDEHEILKASIEVLVNLIKENQNKAKK